MSDSIKSIRANFHGFILWVFQFRIFLALNIPRPYVSSPMSNNRDAKFYEDLAVTLRLELFFENHNVFILNPCLNQLVPRLSGRWSLG